MPPDTEGDVGLTYYVQFNNLGWKYFNKSDGTLAGGPFPGNIFWQGFGGVCETNNAGDPIVLYDQFADRWVFSQFTSPSNPDGHQCFAVTQPGAGPGGPYYLYDFVVSPGQFNDYEKITVWTDGAGQSAYHMSSNEFQGGFVGVNATAFDRDAMLAGTSASFVQFSLATTTGSRFNFSLQPSHLEGNATPPGGTCNKYIQAFDDQTWGSGSGPDGYRIWTYCVDFDTPSNSTFGETAFITSPGFDAELCGYSRDCISQPGTTQRLDTLGQFTMYRFANRYFPASGLRGVISHSVDSGSNVGGVRWAEIDLDSNALLDAGTLAPGDGVSRWMPSVSMDGEGNIGVVFTKSSSAVRPSVYFTGRESGDAPGTLQGEIACIDGTGSQLGGNRWGDYASVSVDPADDCTFWVTNEYVETTGSFQWDTQICSFSFQSCGGGSGCADCIDWSSTATDSYSNQDFSANVAVQDGGDTLYLEDNTWRRTDRTFEITPNTVLEFDFRSTKDTVLEFDFRSTKEGELHGIGFDENTNVADAARIFKIFGSQDWDKAIDWPDPYTDLGTTKRFVIPVGDYYTGSSMFLVLQNDDDRNDRLGTDNNSWFTNVRVYEKVRNCSTEVDFESGTAGWTNSGASTCSTGSFVIGTPTEVVVNSVITQVEGDHTSGFGDAFFSAFNTRAGINDVDAGNCIVESPIYPVAIASEVSIWYFHGQRWADNDPSGDFFRLEISTDGGVGWSPLVSTGDSSLSAAWTRAAAAVPAGSNVKIRIQVSDGTSTLDYIEAGVDDLEICSVD